MRINTLLRSFMQYRRNGMCPVECLVISDSIQKTLLEQHEWKSARSINIYKSIGNEVSTKNLMHTNKEILHPTSEPKDNIEVDLVIAPGVVFDEKCGRYGRGKGYYDRFLKQLPKTSCVIGIAYDFQVLSFGWKLKLNNQDIKMDKIITEKRIIQ